MTTLVERVAASAAREAVRANEEYYASRCSTSYVDSRYHAVRRQIAAELLLAALESPARPVPTGPLLEVGAGAHSIVCSIPTAGRRALVADLSPAALADVKTDGALPLLCDATRSIPLRDSSVAAVVVAELIEHVFRPDDLLREIARVVAPGGWIVVTTPNLATLRDRIRFLFGRSPRHVDPRHPYLGLHIRPMTRSMICALLADAGFDATAVRSNYVSLHPGNGRWLQVRWLARWFPGLGGSLIVAARRRQKAGGADSVT